MNLDPFTGPGSTPSRRRFWDKVTQAVIASQKIAGKNVSVSEHQGMGTLVNVTRGRPAATTGCCAPDSPTITITFAGITICEPATDININGCFVIPVTGTPTTWEGDAGQVLLDGEPLTSTATVACACGPECGMVVSLFVSGVPIFQSTVSPGDPPPTVDNVNCTTCDECGGFGGTATIGCGECP